MLEVLVHFGQALRDAGVPVGTGDILTFSAALARLDLTDMYWVGRTTLVKRKDDIPVYDRVFRAYFLDAGSPVEELMKLKTAVEGIDTTFDIPSVEPGSSESDAVQLGLMASAVEVLRHKSFAACTPSELAALRRIMSRIRLKPPHRRSRRTHPRRIGLLDLRRTIRASLRTGGDPAALLRKQRRVRPRPVVLILDVSGSMASYSRALLQFAYSTGRAADKVEVFCFGTRLARVTHQLRHRDPDSALTRAASRVTDWDGGTRIGSSLDTFVRDWGRRGLCRGGIVVVCSDGLDRGDPDLLASAMERLSRLCYRLVWVTPHWTARPQSLGMMVADPHIDVLLDGHDLDGLAELARVLPSL
ncbi:VWA domain-containing protein [Actinocrispum sp. NPDC049592]|uniref:vWA domain-containing protein n=1 Tax=Actinocrispum sp. NPDC049592 TaxID=3154835 RepID=UPI0034141D1F